MKVDFINEPMTLKRASLISAFFKYSTIVFNIGLTAILARILTPDDYGIVAVVAVFTAFFSIFADMGLSVGIIQDKTLDEIDIANIYSINIYIGIILGMLFAVSAFPISWFYGDEKYIPICLILSISIITNTWSAVPRAILMKNKRFIFVGLQGFIITIISSLFAIFCALFDMKYYSLVLQSVFSGVLTFIWLTLSTRIKYIIKPNVQSIKKIFRLSSYQFAFNFMNYIARNLDNLLTGKLMGNMQLGFYEKAYKLTLYPLQNLTYVITPILHPILSDYQNDKKIIYDKYIKLLNFLSILGIFITIICFFCAREIILIFFGEQWEASITCFRWLSVTIWFQMLTSTIGSIYQSLSNTKLLFKSSIYSVLIIFIFTIIGVLSNKIEVLSIFISIAYFINYFLSFYILIKYCFGFKLRNFYRNLKYDFYMFILLFICGFIINNLIILQNIYISLFLKLFIFLILYFFYLLLFKRMNILIEFIKRKK